MLPVTADIHPFQALGWLQQTAAAARIAALGPSQPWLFIDVETTRDRVVEIAMVRFATGFTPWVYHTMVDPGGWGRSPGWWNTDIHGVTAPMLTGRPTFAALRPTLEAALDGAMVVAHNVSFEQRFLHEELVRAGGIGLTHETVCTLKLARDLLPALDNHRLDTLAAHLDVRNPAPHRALGDTFTTVWVLLALLERHRGARSAKSCVREATRTADGRRKSPWV